MKEEEPKAVFKWIKKSTQFPKITLTKNDWVYPDASKDKPKHNVLEYFVGLLFGLVIIPFLIMILWNCNIPDIFGLPPITFIQSIGLYCLSNLILKNNHA